MLSLWVSFSTMVTLPASDEWSAGRLLKGSRHMARVNNNEAPPMRFVDTAIRAWQLGRLRMRSTWLKAVCMVLFLPAVAFCDTITFEGLSDLEAVTTQFPGLTFSNAILLTAGLSLNEFEFPPASGFNVIFDGGGPVSIAFETPVSDLSALFTYVVPLTVTGFDLDGNLVASATSLFSNNGALSGDFESSPNELLGLTFAGGISRITVMGDPSGGSFVLDDLTFTPTDVAPIPEPSTISLLMVGLAALLALNKKLAFRSSGRFKRG